jgi:hypothetical protein
MFDSRKSGFWIAIAVLVAASVGFYFLNRGIRVGVRNSDTRTLRSVVVHVTGNSYPIGDLPPGEARSVRVKAKGESHVEISFQDEAGKPRTLVAGCYFESGYRGTVKAEIDSEKVRKVEADVHVWP